MDGSQADLARALCRADCDLSAFALALCAATLPDLAASRISSLWKVAAQDPQYVLSERIDLPQILQTPCGFGGVAAGGIVARYKGDWRLGVDDKFVGPAPCSF